MEETKNTTVAMQLMLKINEFQNEIIKSINYIRGDMNEIKDEIKDLKSEVNEIKSEVNEIKSEVNEIKSEVNEIKSEVNEIKSEVNDLKVELKEFKEENKMMWAKYEKDREKDRRDILNILTSYDISISEQLRDRNVEKMRNIV